MVQSALSIMRCTSSGMVATCLSALTTGGPMREVRHEVAVHDVDVDEVGTACLDELDRLAQAAEVRRQDRRGDQDPVASSALPLPILRCRHHSRQTRPMPCSSSVASRPMRCGSRRGDGRTFVQDRSHLTGDRQLDTLVAGRARRRRCSSRRPRRPSASPARRSRSVPPRATCSPKPRLRLCFDVQVAMRSPIPASPMYVSGLAPRAVPRRAHLRQSARHERGLGVVAVAEAVGHAGRDRDDVLGRAAQLDTDDVGVRVHAERRCHEDVLEEAADRLSS